MRAARVLASVVMEYDGAMAPLVVVTGTGTGIGKTVVARGLVRLWGEGGGRIAGVKAIESGPQSAGSDVETLGQVSTFHVTRFPPPYLLGEPVSPHLAARMEKRTIELGVVVAWVESIRAEATGVLHELPGGLFSPLNERETNADLVAQTPNAKVLLVAPDRLGVLHDVISTTRAAAAMGIRFEGVVLVAPEVPDRSTQSNAAELEVLGCPRVLAVVPRAADPSAALVLDALRPVVARLGL